MTNNFYSEWSDCPSHPSYNIILPIMYAMHHFPQLSSFWRKNILGTKSCLRIDKKWRSRTDSNGQYECGHICASSLPQGFLIFHSHTWQGVGGAAWAKSSTREDVFSRQVCRRKQWISATLQKTSGYHIIYDIIYIYHIKKQYLSVSFEHRIISYCIVDSVLRNFLCL
jgi:hypothetical protein